MDEESGPSTKVLPGPLTPPGLYGARGSCVPLTERGALPSSPAAPGLAPCHLFEEPKSCGNAGWGWGWGTWVDPSFCISVYEPAPGASPP